MCRTTLTRLSFRPVIAAYEGSFTANPIYAMVLVYVSHALRTFRTCPPGEMRSLPRTSRFWPHLAPENSQHHNIAARGEPANALAASLEVGGGHK